MMVLAVIIGTISLLWVIAAIASLISEIMVARRIGYINLSNSVDCLFQAINNIQEQLFYLGCKKCKDKLNSLEKETNNNS